MKNAEMLVVINALQQKVEEQNNMIAQLDARCNALESKKAPKKAATSASTKEGTIADTIVGLLLQKVAPKEILAAVREKHKDCKTSLPCVYWYKTRVNKGLYNEVK